MIFTPILVFLTAVCLVHLLVTKPTVWFARRHGFLEAKWKRIAANVAIPELLIIVAGAIFELSAEWRRGSEVQAYHKRLAEERAYVEKVCDPEPKKGNEPDWKYLLCVNELKMAKEP